MIQKIFLALPIDGRSLEKGYRCGSIPTSGFRPHRRGFVGVRMWLNKSFTCRHGGVSIHHDNLNVISKFCDQKFRDQKFRDQKFSDQKFLGQGSYTIKVWGSKFCVQSSASKVPRSKLHDLSSATKVPRWKFRDQSFATKVPRPKFRDQSFATKVPRPKFRDQSSAINDYSSSTSFSGRKSAPLPHGFFQI